jgi:sugar fermentation stimulation protein A
MDFPALVNGRFLSRDNRFRATISIEGEAVWAHVPNSGKLDDLFVPGRPVWAAKAGNPKRKTAYDLKLVELESGLVSVDARLPNPLFAEAVVNGRLPEFAYATIQPEVTIGNSRLDFRLSGADGICWVETKSVTLVKDGTALFPDVPTARGSRHLRELMALREDGVRTAVVFIIQRSDATALSPHAQADPLFTQTLREAIDNGVEAHAYTCNVTHKTIIIDQAVPVILPPSSIDN